MDYTRKTSSFLLLTAIIFMLLAGIARAGTMAIINDRMEFRIWAATATLLPGSSDDPDDAKAHAYLQVRFVNGDAPEGLIQMIETSFTFDDSKWDFLDAVPFGEWISGDVDCDDANQCKNGYISLMLTGTTSETSTNWQSYAKITFEAKCQPTATVSNFYFDSQADNGALVGLDWYNANFATGGFIMTSAYITQFHIDYNDDAEAFMGDEVNVPVHFKQHIRPHRLNTVTHEIDFDTDKLEFVDVIVNDDAFQNSGSVIYDPAGSNPVTITVQDASDGYIPQASSTSEYVKLYDIVFRVKGHSGGPGSSPIVEYVDLLSTHTAWTQWNEGAGEGCTALDNSLNGLLYDGDVDIPDYTAEMDISPVNSYYGKGDGTMDFDVCMKNNFPAGEYASTGTNGEINTLFDMPNFVGFFSLTDSDDLNFGGGSCVNGVRIFHAEQYYDALKASFIQSPSQCTDMYTVTFSFVDNLYTPDWNDRMVEIPWRSTASCNSTNYETSVTDTTGYATLDLGDITETNTEIEVHTGLFTAPYTTDDDRTISQPLYIKSTFDVGEFSIDVDVSGDCYITGVTTIGDAEYDNIPGSEVRIYYDGAAKFCDATGETPLQIATVHYRVNCVHAGKTSDEGPGPGGSYNVTGYVSFNDEEMEMYGGNYQFVDLDPHNVRGKCTIEIRDPLMRETDYSGGIPTAFALLSNRPNPFNPITTISYDLPATEHVLIEVYNIMGQKVATLVDEVMTPGRHEIIWDGTDANGYRASSGIYLYSMRTGEFNDSKKMILMK